MTKRKKLFVYFTQKWQSKMNPAAYCFLLYALLKTFQKIKIKLTRKVICHSQRQTFPRNIYSKFCDFATERFCIADYQINRTILSQIDDFVREFLCYFAFAPAHYVPRIKKKCTQTRQYHFQWRENTTEIFCRNVLNINFLYN